MQLCKHAITTQTSCLIVTRCSVQSIRPTCTVQAAACMNKPGDSLHSSWQDSLLEYLILRIVGADLVGSSPAPMRELLGKSLPFITLFTRAWRGKSLDAFMGVHTFAVALLCCGFMRESVLSAMGNDPAGPCLAFCSAGC